MARTENRFPRRSVGVAVLAAAVIGLAALYLIAGPERNGAETAAPDVAPALAAYAVGDMQNFVAEADPQPAPPAPFMEGGEVRTLKDWRGRVVLLNLWATWCAPCRHEMPSLDRLEAALGSPGFEVVAVSIDRGGPEGPEAFLEEVGATHLTLYHDATARIGPAFNVFGMPTTLLIDREGRVLGRLVGPAEWDTEDAKALIRTALAGG